MAGLNGHGDSLMIVGAVAAVGTGGTVGETRGTGGAPVTSESQRAAISESFARVIAVQRRGEHRETQREIIRFANFLITTLSIDIPTCGVFAIEE